MKLLCYSYQTNIIEFISDKQGIKNHHGNVTEENPVEG
jgi:hypothetical protein